MKSRRLADDQAKRGETDQEARGRLEQLGRDPARADSAIG